MRVPCWNGGRRKLSNSGYYVGQKNVFDGGYAVLERQFAFLQPGHLQLVDEAALRPGFGQRGNRDVEIAVLAAEQSQPLAQFLFIHTEIPENRLCRPLCRMPSTLPFVNYQSYGLISQ